ncbi:hypothetical protein HYH03_004328 [Edaphochlamys debaryana]|uniref:EF-hand domain-containing protein n=1 Tax=Edaphochlamys debaryana TaxID=47281 RepID=A0A835Y777_9CHLO|nr:hypothetical protein HYH03_004328 [Edaphochlamys debaryana]|eukprot:KAG2497582.1 hypothetical protein HYH03_004328 [Edaphochlamys debaryana]
MGTVDPLVAQLWFEFVDSDRSGLLTAKELRQALEIGGLDYSLPQAYMFVRAFDSKNNQKLNVNEFVELHKFLSSVTDAFVGVAGAAGRSVSGEQALAALGRLGYTLDPSAGQAMLQRHDIEGKGVFGRDDFLRIALFMHTSRRAFQAFDTARSGRVDFTFNQFCYASSFLA